MKARRVLGITIMFLPTAVAIFREYLPKNVKLALMVILMILGVVHIIFLGSCLLTDKKMITIEIDRKRDEEE